MNTKNKIIALVGSLLLAFNAQAATVIWEFNFPATGTPSTDPAYPSVARLTLEDTINGVKFTLDPNEANPGYGTNSTVDALNIVFSGAADLPVRPMCGLAARSLMLLAFQTRT